MLAVEKYLALLSVARFAGGSAPLAQLLGGRGVCGQRVCAKAGGASQQQRQGFAKKGQHDDRLSSEDRLILRRVACTLSEGGIHPAFSLDGPQ
jgi:hypothetical protein